MQPYHHHSSPIFSIIITCFNDGEFIEEAIQSVLDSTFKEYEIIIVDDCSTDSNTIEKLNILDKVGYSIICKSVNKGVSDSRNIGILKSKGKYILTLDADDRILPSYLEKSFTHLENGFDVVYCNVKRFGLINTTLKSPKFSFTNLLAGNYIVNCSPFKKQIWEVAGGFDTQMINYEDWEFWIHVAVKGGTFYHIDEVLFEYRAKEASRNTKSTDPEVRERIVQYICSKHAESYQKHIVEIVPYLHKVISTHESNTIALTEFQESVFYKLKRHFDKLR